MKRAVIILVSILSILVCLPVGAVIKTESLPQTLSELRMELSREARTRDASHERMAQIDSAQHRSLVDVIKKCNELSLMLYSQNQEYTFDMTYALREVTDEYQDFNRSRMPFDDMLTHLDAEIDKYSRLITTLKGLPVHEKGNKTKLDSLDAIVMQYPFYLDEESLSDRDSCIYYAGSILDMYNEIRESITNDSAYYDEAAERLKESYDYARDRYRLLQKKMFTRLRHSFVQSLGSFGASWKSAVRDSSEKYARYHFDFRLSFQLIFIYAWLIAALLLSMFARMRKRKLRDSLIVYLPTCVIGLSVIFLRILFIPNSLLNLVFPPFILLMALWYLVTYLRCASSLLVSDRIVSAAGLVVTIAAVVMSWAGYPMLSVLLVIWWLFQLAAIQSIIALYALMDRYGKNGLNRRIEAYRQVNTVVTTHSQKGQYIRVTWFYDLLRMVVLPLVAVFSLPGCVYAALDVFDLTEIFKELAVTEFFDLKDAEGQAILNVSVIKILVFVSLLYVFRYISYLAKAIYMDIRLRTLSSRGVKTVHTNEVNLTLANNVISIVVWGTYAILMITLLKIPTGAISVVATGLAAGLGLAMKDILNNFIYGIQLMSGRLREGDWVECDGVRGKVASISYQSTQIETPDGAEMSFLNASLFSKNFKNLTKINPYELVTLSVGVSYGTDVEKVRALLLTALDSLRTRDAYDREIIDPEKPVSVRLDGFGDSSVDLLVLVYVLVSEKGSFSAKARELIYNVLNENNIEIPFPQRDIHIISNS